MSSGFRSKADLITAIFNRYRHSMQQVAYKILKDTQFAEDTVSEAMIKIIRNVELINDIDSKGCANFVYTITKNTALDLYRKRQSENKKCIADYDVEKVNDLEEAINCDVFESAYGFGEKMSRYINELAPIDIDIIGLKYGDGFTYREIGLILEMNEDAVRKRAFRAREKLEIMIREGV